MVFDLFQSERLILSDLFPGGQSLLDHHSHKSQFMSGAEFPNKRDAGTPVSTHTIIPLHPLARQWTVLGINTILGTHQNAYIAASIERWQVK